jgi:hypothetical protein
MNRSTSFFLVCSVILLSALTATVASAAGLSVNWGNACWGDAPRTNLDWACDSDHYTGVRMTCSFKAPTTKSTLVAVDLYMEGMTETATVPDWWKLGSGDCRSGLVSLSADASVLSGPDCRSVWQGLSGGGIGLYSWDTNRMHINAVWALADPVEAPAETEVFAAQFVIATGKTVGTGCPGCEIPAVWVLDHILVGYLDDALSTVLDSPYDGGNQCLSWQSSSLPRGKLAPTRNTTWGQIKSLYR